jgi:hypothetical protein
LWAEASVGPPCASTAAPAARCSESRRSLRRLHVGYGYNWTLSVREFPFLEVTP